MKDSEAVRVVSVLGAYFPTRPLTNETAALWARAITEFEMVDALEATETLGTMGRFLPSLMEFTDSIRDCRNRRLMRERPAIGPGPDHGIGFQAWLEGFANEDQKATVRRVFPGLAKKYGIDVDAED